MNSLVCNWFGKYFSNLDSLLQDLHRNGGELKGDVDLIFGTGIAGIVGKRLAVKLGLPVSAGTYNLQVSISHQQDTLQWARRFDTASIMVSEFAPIGQYPAGYWVETTGPWTLHLGVQVIAGGWHWDQRKLQYRGVALPVWIYPKTTAYKTITDGKYEFSVSIAMPFIGQCLCYRGQLMLN